MFHDHRKQVLSGAVKVTDEELEETRANRERHTPKKIGYQRNSKKSNSSNLQTFSSDSD